MTSSSTAAEAMAAAAARAQAYLEHVPERRVYPQENALRALDALCQQPLGAEGDALETIAMLDEVAGPATVASAGGRFFGLVVGGALPAALGARVLAAAWDQIAFNETTSPAAAQIERCAARWLLELFGLPEDSAVGFVTGATMANFSCLAAARRGVLAAQGWDVDAHGLWDAPRLRVVASEEAHSTVLKALRLLGMGVDAIERAPVDEQGRMRADALPPLDERTIVLTQAGNVHSGACDPIGAVVERARAVGAWVHVDGAFGLWAAAAPSTRAQIAGFEAADSWSVDAHKWLNTPYDCGMAICRVGAHLQHAMTATAPSFGSTAALPPREAVGSALTPEFSRAARGVEVWAALRSLGRDGVAALIERCCALARRFGAGLERLGFELLNEMTLNQIVATLPGREERCERIASDVRFSGEAWIDKTRWRGRDALRISVSSWATTEADIDRALRAIETALDGR